MENGMRLKHTIPKEKRRRFTFHHKNKFNGDYQTMCNGIG
jgi:hypothetical protein